MRLGLLSALAAIALLALTTSDALAGSYQVATCNDTAEGVNNSWTWSLNDPSQPAHYAEHENCPYRIGGSGGLSDQEGGLSTTDALRLSNGAPPSTSAGWSFVAPPGTTISGLQYERYFGHEFDPDNLWVPALRIDGATVASETCANSVEDGETCAVGGSPGQGGVASFSGLAAREISVGIVCAAPPEEVCVTGSGLHATWAAMYGASVTVADQTPPTLSTPTGPLWGSGEAGVHKGTESVTVAAEDVGGGVQSVALLADGRQMASFGPTCNFTLSQPCPSAIAPQTFALPTTQLPDGTHMVEVVATDAAGNRTAESERIVVQNAPPPAPGVWTTATRTTSSGTAGAAGTASTRVHLSESLSGRKLIVRVSASASGKVRVGFVGKLHGRTVASGARTTALRKGGATAIFKLGPRTAAHALIRVNARLNYGQVVRSTLKRRPSP
jgi:hypothetical protein